MQKKTIGIVGCGAIGTILGEYIEKNLASKIAGIVLCDSDPAKAESLAGKVSNAAVSPGIKETVKESDLVIEAASSKVSPAVLREAISAKKDIIIMSIGGLLGEEELLEGAREKGVKVMLPSGAIAGIDAVKAAAISGIEKVTLTTRKPPKSIKGAPYLIENHIDVDALEGEAVVFEGAATEAMKGFPKNINVSALLSLAGIGGEKTHVKIVVSPACTKNIHEIEIRSKAGIITTRCENVPSPANPKTSYLAALAAIASLKGYFDTVRIGT